MKKVFSKSALSKITAILTALPLLLALALPASAAGGDRLPLIIVNGMNESPMLVPDGSQQAFPPLSEDITSTVLRVLPYVPLLAVSKDAFADRAYPIIKELFEDIVFEPDGRPKHPLGQVRFPDSYAGDKTGMIDTVSHGGLARLYGADRAYQYVVDWRQPAAEAGGIHEMIQEVKARHGVKKVNVIAVSMGGAAAMSYVAKYGHGDLNNFVMMHSVFQGIYVVGDLFNGRITLDAENIRRYLNQSMEGNEPLRSVLDALLGVLDSLGALGAALGYAEELVSSLEPRIFDELLTPVFGQLPGFWGLVPEGDYESAKALMLDPEAHAGLIERIDDYHYNVLQKAPALLRGAMADGVNVYVLSGYNFAAAPVGDRANTHTDDGLSTARTSGGAVCAPLGRTLGDGYVQAVACGHNHICPDKMIDASPCILPEQTWFQKDLHHASFFSDDCLEFLLWLLTAQRRQDVRSKAAYPQFLQYDSATGALIPLGGGESLSAETAAGSPASLFPDTGEGSAPWAVFALLLPAAVTAVFQFSGGKRCPRKRRGCP
ncbi:MAG: alpha/beta hydrolase [Oscillospiraceae bacterium]|nr:alpha/beta hydrolase [Oscillospiraceae bacterium]